MVWFSLLVNDRNKILWRLYVRSFYGQIYDEGNCHTDTTDADEALDEFVAFLALRETAKVAAKPCACRHDDGDGPVDFSGNSQCNRAYDQEHIRECVLDGVHVNRVKARVARESENLYKTDTHLHNAAIYGDTEKSEGAFDGELFGRCLRGLSENVLAQVAHDHHKAYHDGENRLK